MNKNFKISQAIYLVKESEEIDLHNWYNFAGIELQIADSSATIHFEPWDGGAATVSLAIDFKSIEYLELSSGLISHGSCDIDELGYKSPEDNNLDWLKEESESHPNDHLIIRMTNGEYLRLRSKYAELRVTN